MSPSPLGDFVAVVTGGASGIGAAAGHRLAQDGAIVVLVDVQFESEDPEGHGVHTHLSCDVTRSEDVQAAAAAVLGAYGRCDVLVNCAGVAPVGDAISCAEGDWDQAFSVNARGTWLVCKAFLPSMVSARRGSIINVASAAGIRPAASMVAYSASKAAVVSLTRSIARDFVRHGVRANALCPGPVDTPLHWNVAERRRRGGKAEADDGFGPAKAASVEEMAEYIAMLANPMMNSLTGSALAADGGRVMH